MAGILVVQLPMKASDGSNEISDGGQSSPAERWSVERWASTGPAIEESGSWWPSREVEVGGGNCNKSDSSAALIRTTDTNEDSGRARLVAAIISNARRRRRRGSRRWQSGDDA